MATDPLQLNLGSLRSEISLTLHSFHAARIWNGRPASADRSGIPGLTSYLSIMGKMKRAAEQDDPYADWWMLRMEDRLAEAKARLEALREQVKHVLARVPTELSIGENLNVQPVRLPLFASAQLGFSAVYLLADYDKLARELLLAHHTALINRTTLEQWLYDGGNALRGLFALAGRYSPSGATRADFAANSPAAQAAIERLGQLPPEVMDGTRRSGFAPPLRRPATTMTSTTALPAQQSESAAAASTAAAGTDDIDDDGLSRDEDGQQ